MARGHPIGASGAVLAVRLFHQMGQARLGLAAIAAAGAIGSASVAAALLYAGKRRKKPNEPTQPGPIPSGEPPQTD